MAVHFEANAEPIPGYRMLDRLGSGGFGEVWKCIAPGGIYKAIKIIHGDLRSKDNDLVRYAEQELKSMERVKQVRHPYLLALDRYDIVEGRLLIVMELADCNLWDRFRVYRQKGLIGIPRDELMVYMQEAAEVLDLMNGEHGLLHLDVKPQNIFLQWNHVKVGDFGQVKDLQGLAAQVTGGITPVYAAPETFDGIVTRACDQYSLACVYQELLTGNRPFDGTSMNQLLMQHLAAPPNLNPSPEADRPALRRALAKKSEERFATCMDFVRALRAGVTTPPPTSIVLSAADRPSVAAPLLGSSERSDAVSWDATSVGSSLAMPVDLVSIKTDTPLPAGTPDADPPRLAPPELTGDGSLQPTLLIGIGASGRQVLQRFRADIADHYGNPDAIAAIRTLYLDTDPQAAELGGHDKPWERLAALPAEQIFPTRLNRPTHYMKPRLSGHAITEGWFDTQLLNKLPRTPVTMGYRPFGRLAFFDHFRSLSQKITYDLEAILDPDALTASLEHTGLELRTNRPRVYVVAALAGGTGGMFLDVAYTVRHRLKKMGYAKPDVVGLFFVPPDGPTESVPPLVRANVCAALTELNHYSRPGTIFQAFYDERSGGVRDADAPFTATYILPAPLETVNTPAGTNSSAVATSKMARRTSSDIKALSSSRVMPKPATTTLANDPIATAVARVRYDLFTPVGRMADAARPRSLSALGITVRTFGRSRFSWPRGAIVDRTARVLTGVLLTHWVSPDITRARHLIPAWVSEKMNAAGLSKDAVQTALHKAAAAIFQEPIPTVIAKIVDPVTPKGWMARTPDVNKVIGVLDQLGKAIGHPTGQKLPTALEEALRSAANDVAATGGIMLTTAVHEMIDDPRFRLASAEEAIQQILTYLQVCRAECDAEADRLDRAARAGYDPLMAYVHPQSGAKKPSANDIAEAFRSFPGSQFQAGVARRTAKLFEHLKLTFAELRLQISASRQRIEVVQKLIVTDLEQPSPVVDASYLMPPGCPTIEDAAQRYLQVLTDDDLQEIERLVQIGIEEHFGGLYQASVNSTLKPEMILDLVRARARLHLNSRLGEVDLAGMFKAKWGGKPEAAQAVGDAYRTAKPTLVGNGPWVNHAVTVLGTPAAAAGEHLRQLADHAFPSEDKTLFADTPDEMTVYREYPDVPLAVLPQFGPAWEAAYSSFSEASPHARTDVTQWIGVDAE
ncbi:tubulin-like doman-containing protein [Limnoglobus roseus]|uniref:Serine/threonine protein kinase n=1 Tax=Limnoglobus roseus TaxID=2598579 RepID=A0A5C1A5J4_9BACT|nr:tubulin-like doman-containing protein [Limnoglobus roseus]QEL13623.1 serine/threonine protein kinase [Limnoglobus roseus]